MPRCDYAPGNTPPWVCVMMSEGVEKMADEPTQQDGAQAGNEPGAGRPVPKSVSKVPFIVTFLAVGIVTLVFLTGISSGRYNLEIQNVVENQGEYADKDIKVVGRIKDGWRGERNNHLIDSRHAGREITVSYAHNRPDPFKEGRKCIVEGRLRPDGVIECTKLTVKCPSKYQSENDLEGGNEGSYDNSGSSP